MKRRDFSLAAVGAATVAGLPLTVQAQGPAVAKKPVEGTDYLSLDKRVPTDVGAGKIELIEFFWYSCPHCNSFEPQFAAWVKAAPKDVVVQRVPVRFRDDFEAQQRAYYVFESLNMVDALHGKLFHAIHTERQQLNTAQALAAWANKNGLPEKKFLDTFKALALRPRPVAPRNCKTHSKCKAYQLWVLRVVFTQTAHSPKPWTARCKWPNT
jgi:thiol:disulfide interchange protein DsbA